MKWLLPVIFIGYYGSISLFMHVHIEHGTTIVHSHPFKKTTRGEGHHHASLYEIQLFHYLTTVQVQDGAVHTLQLNFYALPVYALTQPAVPSEPLSPLQGKVSLRAPPAA